MTTTATMETVLTDQQQTLLNRFYHACDAARRFSRDEYHLAVNVTRLWNWIDADGLPLEHGLTEVLWHCLARVPRVLPRSRLTKQHQFRLLEASDDSNESSKTLRGSCTAIKIIRNWIQDRCSLSD